MDDWMDDGTDDDSGGFRGCFDPAGPKRFICTCIDSNTIKLDLIWRTKNQANDEDTGQLEDSICFKSVQIGS